MSRSRSPSCPGTGPGVGRPGPSWSLDGSQRRRGPDCPRDHDVALQAQAALEANKPADAETILNRILAVDPDHPFANELMGDACIALKRSGDAEKYRKKRIAAYAKELREAPDSAELHAEFAEYLAHTDSGSPETLNDALQLARKAVELEPLDPAYRAQFADLLARNGRWDEAVAEIRVAIDQNPDKDAYREALRSYQAGRTTGGKK